MAECHPVGFQWVMEAKGRGAKIIHVDPRFTRTSAIADLHVPIRAGTDIAFLGGLVNHVLSNDLDFREYVVAYTNAATIIDEDFRDTEDLDGLFSGFDPEAGHYDPITWRYDAPDDPDEEERQRAVELESQEKGGTGSKQSHQAARSESHGAGGAPVSWKGRRDETLQHPRCVFQILKRHFARYTPEMVEEVCGVARSSSWRSPRRCPRNSGRERTSAFCYAVGWTQHTRRRADTSARPRSSSCCSATSAGRAAASWRCAATPPSRARPTSRRSTTSCPATCRCRTPVSTRAWTSTSQDDDGARPAGGATSGRTSSAC